MSIPLPIKNVALVCRRPWKFSRGSLFFSRKSGNHFVTVYGCISVPSHLIKSLLLSPQRKSFPCWALLYSSKRFKRASLTDILRPLDSFFGDFVNTPCPGRYWLACLMVIVLLTVSTSCHSRPMTSPSLAPVISAIMVAALYFTSSGPTFSRATRRALTCFSL